MPSDFVILLVILGLKSTSKKGALPQKKICVHVSLHVYALKIHRSGPLYLFGDWNSLQTYKVNKRRFQVCCSKKLTKITTTSLKSPVAFIMEW